MTAPGPPPEGNGPLRDVTPAEGETKEERRKRLARNSARARRAKRRKPEHAAELQKYRDMEAAGRVRLRADDARLARKKEQDAAARARYREKGKAQKAQKAQEREAQEAQEVQEAEVREAQETQEAGHYPFVYYWPQEEQEAADLLARARQVAQEVAAERAAVAERLEVGTRTRRHQAWAGLVMNPVPQAAPVAGTSGTTYEGDDQRSVDERQRQRRRDELQQQLQRERGQYDQMQWEDGRGRGGR